jgi:hypothetical protein
MFTSMTSPYCCPICLDPPVLPRISRCGHTFCWICLMQYAALNGSLFLVPAVLKLLFQLMLMLMFFLSEKGRWVRCPICFECILLNEIRGVHMERISHVRNDDSVTFELLCRSKSHTLVSPRVLKLRCPRRIESISNSFHLCSPHAVMCYLRASLLQTN